MPVGAGLLKFAKQLAYRVIGRGCGKHDILEVFRHEHIVEQGFLDAFRNLCALLLERLHTQRAGLRLGEDPTAQHGEAVEALLEQVAQLGLVARLQLAVLAVLRSPLPGRERGAGQDQQFAVKVSIAFARAGQNEAHGVAATLQVCVKPATENRTQRFRNFGQHHQGGPQIGPLLR